MQAISCRQLSSVVARGASEAKPLSASSASNSQELTGQVSALTPDAALAAEQVDEFTQSGRRSA